MKPRLTPDQAERLERMISDLDDLYLDLTANNPDMEPFHMGKVSTARADLAFVLGSTYRTPVIRLDTARRMLAGAVTS